MIILSHRGYWIDGTEKNQDSAFRRSFDLGFGTETDLRDDRGRLVISHDMPHGEEMGLDDFLDILGDRQLPLAINIKSDGLAVPLARAMRHRNIHDWFVFDMSVPDMRSHLATGNPTFARVSEFENAECWLPHVSGVWLDSFQGTWFDLSLLQRLLNLGKRVCIVSSELHGRPHIDLWDLLRPIQENDQLMLCTDNPEHARDYFGIAQ